MIAESTSLLMWFSARVTPTDKETAAVPANEAAIDTAAAFAVIADVSIEFMSILPAEMSVAGAQSLLV